jgi:hypothetical protein
MLQHALLTHKSTLLMSLILMGMLALAACREPQATTDAQAVHVESAIEVFHEHYNDQEFAELYEHAGGRFAQETSEEEVSTFLADLRQTLGAVESFEIAAQDIVARDGAQEAAAKVITTFENDNGTEYFTFRFTEYTWTWTNYRIESTLLTDQVQDAQGE